MKNHGLLYLGVAALLLTLIIARYASSSSFSSISSSETTAEMAATTSAATVQYRWNPTDEHPCNIRRVSLDQLPTVFAASGGLIPPLHHEPLVIVATENNDHRKHTNGSMHHHHHHSRNAVFRHKTSLEHILDNFPENFTVTLSSSNQFSEHRRTIPLAQYLQETVYLLMETLPEQLANESWYLFGETYTDEWMQGLLRHYELPPCLTCQTPVVALSFGIGNRGSGVQWHTHGPGFSEALHGRKHWVLYPPHQPPRELHKDQSSRSWMEHVYPHLASDNKPYECTLDPGDLIYFPDRWWHATINLDPYTAFISTFTTEHNVVMDDLFHKDQHQQQQGGEQYDSLDLSTLQQDSGRQDEEL